MIDLAIVLALAAGAFAGFRKGFIVPLVVQAGAPGSLAAVYAGPLQGSVPSRAAGMGMGIGAGVLGSSILGAVGGMLGPVVYRVGLLPPVDQGAGIPPCAAAADRTMLNTIAAAAAKAPIPTDQLAQYDAALGFYEASVRPALLSSKIAPLLLAIGEKLPIVGQKVTFPTK